MAVVGYGIDVVSVERIERAIDRFGERFLERVFTEAEREFCLSRKRPAESFAVRFGAKEAFVKACGADGVLASGSRGRSRSQRRADAVVEGQGERTRLKEGAREFSLALARRGVGVAGVILEGERPERR